MPITKAFLIKVRDFLLRLNRIVAIALLILFGWFVLPLALIATAVADAVGLLDRKNRVPVAGRVGVGVVALVALALLGGSSKPATEATVLATPSPSAGRLVITDPSDGTTVGAGTIIVTGTAPIGARVVHDISLAPDDDTTASDGTWSIAVKLSDGDNDLVFRLGEDQATSVHLHVRLAANLTTPSPIGTAPASPQPTPEPTPEPTPDATPEPVFATIEDGTWAVGSEITAGTYRLREPVESCYWARLKGFDGSLDEIIANDNLSGYGVVTISKTDKGFETSGCGEWSKDLSRVTDSRTAFDDGTYIVATDIKPGTYRNAGGDTCYWARLSGFGGTLNQVIANHLAQGSTVVTIRSTDKGFKSSGCGTWNPK